MLRLKCVLMTVLFIKVCQIALNWSVLHQEKQVCKSTLFQLIIVVQYVSLIYVLLGY